MMKAILHNSKFAGIPNGDGGHRRTAQIKELVSLSGSEINDIKIKPVPKIDKYISGINCIAKYKLKIFPSYKVIGDCGQKYHIYHKCLREHQGEKLLVWEATENYIAPYVAKQFGFKILALPHNIESLVTDHGDPLTWKYLPDSLESEIYHLAKADAIFCISREEQWLLKLRGINADFLPYYPPKSVLSNLLEIRQIRNNSQPQRFLILGTAENPPTRLGMIEQIQWLSEIETLLDCEVDIAGYGTEKLQEYCKSPKFILHGAVEQKKLNHLLINAKAVLVHQKAGVGALTRIPEMIIAGIPVIANSNSCRSAFDYPGVYCYDNQHEMTNLLFKNLDIPVMLERPISAEKRFIDCLQELSTSST
ncbi:MAG: glycosyltransferase [Fischerella sp. CENA71]|nr:glycosyltransferase [Fischerella sp. CENA71]